jgi:hypothetical protein
MDMLPLTRKSVIILNVFATIASVSGGNGTTIGTPDSKQLP